MGLDVEEVKENQEALEGLMRYAGVPEKWIKLISAAYSAQTAYNNAQRS